MATTNAIMDMLKSDERYKALDAAQQDSLEGLVINGASRVEVERLLKTRKPTPPPIDVVLSPEIVKGIEERERATAAEAASKEAARRAAIEIAIAARLPEYALGTDERRHAISALIHSGQNAIMSTLMAEACLGRHAGDDKPNDVRIPLKDMLEAVRTAQGKGGAG